MMLLRADGPSARDGVVVTTVAIGGHYGDLYAKLVSDNRIRQLQRGIWSNQCQQHELPSTATICAPFLR
jgi:hypothetical protein